MAAAGREGDSESAAKFESEQQQHQQQQEDRIQTTNVDTSGCLDHNQASHYGPQQEEVADVGGAPQTPSGANRPKRRRRTKEQREEEQQQSQPQEQQQQQYQHQQQKHVASVSLQDENRSHQANNNPSQRPLILITEPESCSSLKSHLEEEFGEGQGEEHLERGGPERTAGSSKTKTSTDDLGMSSQAPTQATTNKAEPMPQEEDQFEVIDGISYRIVAAVTKRPDQQQTSKHRTIQSNRDQTSTTSARNAPINRRSQSTVSTQQTGVPLVPRSKFQSVRRKSSAFVANLLQGSTSFLVPQSRSSHAIDSSQHQQPNRRMSIYEMTKSPPPETSIEMYLNERRRSSTVSAKFVQQQLEQQSTFESNYCARQQYFKDLNSKLINQDKKLLNVVANRGQIHRHSVDIAQLPLFLAQSKSGSFRSAAAPVAGSELGGVGEQLVGEGEILEEEEEEELEELEAEVVALGGDGGRQVDDHESEDHRRRRRQLHPSGDPINQVSEAPGSTISENDTDNKEEDGQKQPQQQQLKLQTSKQRTKQQPQLAPISEAKAGSAAIIEQQRRQQRDSLGQLSQLSTDKRHKRLHGSTGLIVRRFQKFDASALSSAPSPDVKIGQRVAYKEYYGNEFGTIRWIGRVPQISPDWTVGVEFDNAIGEGDGSLNGRRYFIAKDCFAKFLPLMAVALVDQHVGRPEPGTMISVMSAAVRPGQMISIQRVSTVHVQHCFLNAPHRRPGAEFLAVNTRLHCQCPSCGPCAHVVKPPRTQRLMTPKNATHMCQFSTYTCCGMESSDEALCTYTGNRISSSSPPPPLGPQFGRGGGGNVYGSTLPPIGNSWMEGSGYLTNLQAEQRKLMPEEYRLGAAPEDTLAGALLRRGSSGRRRRHGRDPPTDHKSPNDAEIYADHDREGAAGLHSMMASSFSPSSVACDRSAQASPVAAAHLKHQPIAHDDDGTPLQPDDERRRHHHHHKHHHKHHRRANSGETRSKSPPDELLQPDEEGAAVPPPPSCSPVYANLHDHQQQQPIVQLDQLALAALARGRGSLGEAIDMQSERQQQHHHKQPTKPRNQFYEQTGLKNDPDTTQFADDETSRRLGGQDLSSGSQRQQQQQSRDLVDNSEQGAGMAEARDMNRTQQQQQQQSNIATSESMVPCPDNSNNKEDEDQLNAAMATRAVQYRDSIENRYLFPTDDIIDSTLEADLETLSQARYGRFGGAHSSVSNCSSEEESSSRRPWRRGRGRRTKGRAKRTHWRRGGGNSNNNRSSNNKHRTRTARTRGRGGEGGDDYDEDDDDQDDDFDGQQQHLASAMRPNIILKGLRSLVVSCLSANEQHSANTTPTSNNNKSQSSHHYHAHNHHHHQHNNSNHHPPLCNQAYESHDSAEGAATAATAQCCCRYETSTLAAGAAASFESAGGQSGDYSGPAGEPLQQGPIIASTNTTTTSNEIVASHHQVVDQLNFNKSSRPTGAAYMSWRAEEEAYYMNLDLGGPNGVTNHHQHGYYYDDEDDEAADDDVDHCDDDHSERDRFQEEETVAHQHQRHHHRQHQHRHQHHSRNYHGPRQSAAAANSQPTSRRRRRQDETNESARRQISSSSDCGFSSASQNSMNLTNSNPSCSPTKFSEEEQRRLNQIYKRLAAQLANSATGGTGSEGVAVGGGAGNGANGQHQHHRASATSEDLLRLKRALVAIHSESCCQNSRCTSPLERQNQTGGGGAPVTGSPLAADSAAGKQNHLEESSCLQKARSPSRNDDDQDATHRKGSLARAFELKLTLSINPDPMAQATTTTTTAATLDTKGLTSQQSANTGGDSCQMLDRRSSSRT